MDKVKSAPRAAALAVLCCLLICGVAWPQATEKKTLEAAPPAPTAPGRPE